MNAIACTPHNHVELQTNKLRFTALECSDANIPLRAGVIVRKMLTEFVDLLVVGDRTKLLGLAELECIVEGVGQELAVAAAVLHCRLAAVQLY